MNRNITNIIRYCMDELTPGVIRNSKWFMYPFYYFAYRGKNISEVMDFKKRVYEMTPKEYAEFYQNLDTISRNRLTDLNEECINEILNTLKNDSGSLLDVGCGNGHLLSLINQANKDLELKGFDIKETDNNLVFEFTQGNMESLPFEDKSIDTIVCTHVLEHCLKPNLVIDEMIRVARKKIIVVVPKQKYFYYTLDEHVNFYENQDDLVNQIKLNDYSCKNLAGDWLYIASLQ